MNSLPTPHPQIKYTSERFDAGMGETEYNIFADGVFFAKVNNSWDVDLLIRAMTDYNHTTSAEQVLMGLERTMKNLHDVEELSYPDLWNELLIQLKELRTRHQEQQS